MITMETELLIAELERKKENEKSLYGRVLLDKAIKVLKNYMNLELRSKEHQ